MMQATEYFGIVIRTFAQEADERQMSSAIAESEAAVADKVRPLCPRAAPVLLSLFCVPPPFFFRVCANGVSSLE